MGGTVAFTLRLPDGTEYRMNRWTNILPLALTNLYFLGKNEEFLQSILTSWREMSADYERNKETGDFEFNMTSCYFPSAGLAPVGYGLVVADTINNVILTNQTYTSIGKIYFNYSDVCNIVPTHGSSLAYAEYIRELKSENKCTLAECEYGSNLALLFLAGRIKEVQIWNKTTDTFVFVDISQMTLEELLNDMLNNSSHFNIGCFFPVDMAPFTVEQFEPTTSGFLVMKKRVSELGFKLNESEEKTWTDYVKQIEEIEEE